MEVRVQHEDVQRELVELSSVQFSSFRQELVDFLHSQRNGQC